MDWTTAATRADIASWRDMQRLAAAAMLNAIAVEALAAFDASVPEADRRGDGAHVEDRIDRAMADAVRRALGRLLADAARTLRSIDAKLEPLAVTLPGDGWPTLPQARAAPGRRWQRTTVTLPRRISAWKLAQIGRDLFERATNGAGETVDDAGAWLRERTGVHDRMRSTARTRVRAAWLGETGLGETGLGETGLGETGERAPGPRPVLAQLDATFDRVAERAREMTA